jgi:hypothetical protein
MFLSQNPFFGQLDNARTVALKIEELCVQTNFPKLKLTHGNYQGASTMYHPRNDEGFFIANAIRFGEGICINVLSIEYMYCGLQLFEITCMNKLNQWEIQFDKQSLEENGKCSRQQEFISQKILAQIGIYPKDELKFLVSEAKAWHYIEKLLALAKEHEEEPYKLTPVQPCAHQWQHHCNWCTSKSGHVGPNMFEAHIACDFCPKKIEMECGFEVHVFPVMKTFGITGLSNAIEKLVVLQQQFACQHTEVTQKITIDETANTATILRACVKCTVGETHQHILWGNLTNDAIKPPTFTTK